MKTISAATLLALVSAAQAQTSGFDAITVPTNEEVVAACSSLTIDWDYTSTYAGTVTLQLLQGSSPSTLQLGDIIVANYDNSIGQYTWSVPCDLGADAVYGIKITYDNDSTGNTFQYSFPFSITASAATTSSSSSAAAATSAAATTPAVDAAVSSPAASTLYSTEYVTVTSCAATITDCPARSTVVSSTVYPVLSTTGVPAVPTAGSPTGAGSVPPVSSPKPTTLAPVYPVGNSSTTASSPNGLGTVTLPASKTTTGGAGAATTAPVVVTAGAGRVVGGAIAAALVALFAL